VTPTIGLALIARDEAETLPVLLASIEGAFDQVALLDTGSTDRTVETFEQWAARQDLPLGYVLDRFEWCDDFAAARNAADDLLETDWLSWADCDDQIVGAESLRGVVAQTDPLVSALACVYRFCGPDGQPLANRPQAARDLRLRDPAGGEISIESQRLRLRRREAGAYWRGRVHEDITFEGSGQRLPPEICRWHHLRDCNRPSSLERNDRILEAWVADEPRNLRPLGMLAAREVEAGRFEQGLDHFARYIETRYVQPLDPVDLCEREGAAWAFGELARACRSSLPDDELTRLSRAYMAVLLSREPAAWQAPSIKCAEDRRNPEPTREETRECLTTSS
jgi:Glycosyl transferase family 2